MEFMRKEAADNALSLDGTSFMSRILKVNNNFFYFLLYDLVSTGLCFAEHTHPVSGV